MDMTQASVNPDSHIEKQVAMPLLLENHFGRMPGFQKHMERLYAASEALIEKSRCASRPVQKQRRRKRRQMDYSDGLPAIDPQNSYSRAPRHAVMIPPGARQGNPHQVPLSCRVSRTSLS